MNHSDNPIWKEAVAAVTALNRCMKALENMGLDTETIAAGLCLTLIPDSIISAAKTSAQFRYESSARLLWLLENSPELCVCCLDPLLPNQTHYWGAGRCQVVALKPKGNYASKEK
jgi:hypothetical protein